ncbi:MAG: heparinase II/III family protein [Sedimentisphaerales bacterium]|nr:heparinase II/III family protein [Sedimentisphaerales bacterium]
MGRIALGMGMAYDLIYPALTEDERARIRAGILKLGIQPVYDEYVVGERRIFLCNWMGVNVGGAGVCALAIAGDNLQNPKEMEPYIAGFIDRYKAFINHTVGVNGAYGEGVSYLSYGFEVVPYLMIAAREAAGVDFFRESNLRWLWTYPAYMMSPSKKGYANIGDCEYVMRVADHIYLMCAQATSNRHAQWFFHNGKNFTADSGLTNFIFYDPDIRPAPPDTLPTSRYFPTFGTAVFRTGWDPEDVLFVFHSGPVHTHHHAARNHFILEALGEPLAIDMGDGGRGYTNPLYKTYYRQSVAHNLVLVNNNSQTQSWHPGGQTSDFVGSKYYDSVVGDAHLCCKMLSENRREVVFIKPHYFVIFDRMISSKGPVEFNWLLHAIGKGNITIDDNTVTIKKGEARLAVKFLEPVGCKYKIRDGHDAKRTEGIVETEYISVDTPTKVEEGEFLCVLYPYKSDSSFKLPPISKLRADNALGVKIKRDGVTDQVLFASEGKVIESDGLSTDGTKCTLSLASTGAFERYAMHQGRYFRYKDKMLLSAEVPATMAFGSLEKDCIYGFADVPSDTSVAIFVSGNPLRVEIDQVIADRGSFTYDKREKLLTLGLKRGSHRITIWHDKGVVRQENEFNIAYLLCSDPYTSLKLNVTEKELDEDFKRIKAIGFTHVTLWAGSVLNEEIENVALMKLAVEKAAKHDLRCYIWFWTAGKPLMYGQPGWDAPPMVDKNGKEVKYMNIWDETWRRGFLRDYLHWLGKTFGTYPNVAGYVVDEPFGSWWKWQQYGYDVQISRQFVAWLRQKYGDIKKLNREWDTNYQKWIEITPPQEGAMKNPEWRDWTEARRQFSVDWVADMNCYLKEAHPGSRILWSITARYVDNAQADELADCLDWEQIIPQMDAILMAKFPTKKGQEQFIPFTRDVLRGLSRKPEAEGVDKICALVLWESSWVSKIDPVILQQVLELVASNNFSLYIWAWQGADHLESWVDLQTVLREFIYQKK